MKNDFSIIIYDNIASDELEKNWKILQEKTKCFPQLYYEWCEPWWRYRSGNRKLHIVSVFDHDNIIGLAPLCIEKQFQFQILKSFPIHFTDFYSFIIHNSNFNEVVQKINEYITSYKNWHFVQLSKINNFDPLCQALISSKLFKHKLLTKIHIADYSSVSFVNSVINLSKRDQKNYQRKIEKIKESGILTLKCVEDASSFKGVHPMLKEMYDNRWKNDSVKPPGEDYYLLEREAVTGLFEKGNVVLYLLYLDNLIIAYKWGIIYKNTYYAWRVCHHPGFNQYSPGIMIIGMVIDELNTRGIKKVNFGAGDYDWKKRWATPKYESANFDLFGSSGSIKSRLYLFYRLKYRDRFKSIYHIFLNYSLFRKLNRILRSSK